MSVKERLKFFIKNQNLSVIDFEKSINSSNGYVNSISKSIGIDKLNKIIEIYSINIEWLLTGHGEMLKKPPSQDDKTYPRQATATAQEDEISKRDLFKQIDKLTQTVLEQQKTISNLHQEIKESRQTKQSDAGRVSKAG